MKRLLLVALPVGVALLAVVMLLSAQRSQADAYEARLERARLKREFSERVGALRALPPDQAPAWRDEVLALTRWYLDAVQAVRNRHPGEPRRPSAVEAAEAERKKPLKPDEKAQFEDFQKYAEGRLALLREGRFAPVAAAVTAGLRLDLLAVEPGASPQGGPGLRVDFALWGAPRYVEREEGRDRAVTKTIVPVALKSMVVKLLDAKGKPYGEMSGSGEPYQKLVDPDRFVEDFPPGALFGTWWLELLPREAATLQLEVLADVRGATGVGHPAAFQVTLPIPEAWKLPPGATFEAQVREAAPEPASTR
jgi:hypothetical protein